LDVFRARKLGRFSVDVYLKRQKHVIHGAEARVLKHIPKIIFKICERLIKLSNCGPAYDVDDELNFTKDRFLQSSISAKKIRPKFMYQFGKTKNKRHNFF
jgi:hypothetical protein